MIDVSQKNPTSSAIDMEQSRDCHEVMGIYCSFDRTARVILYICLRIHSTGERRRRVRSTVAEGGRSRLRKQRLFLADKRDQDPGDSPLQGRVFLEALGQ